MQMIPDEWKLVLYLLGLVFIAGGAFANLKRMDGRLEKLERRERWANSCIQVVFSQLGLSVPKEPE